MKRTYDYDFKGCTARMSDFFGLSDEEDTQNPADANANDGGFVADDGAGVARDDASAAYGTDAQDAPSYGSAMWHSQSGVGFLPNGSVDEFPAGAPGNADSAQGDDFRFNSDAVTRAEGSFGFDASDDVPGANPDAEETKHHTRPMNPVAGAMDSGGQLAMAFDQGDATYGTNDARPADATRDDDASEADDAGSGKGAATVARKKHHAGLWILLVVIVLLAAACAYGYNYFQTRALPGVTLQGVSMQGRTKQQIADQINQTFADATTTVTYNDQSVDITLSDLGYSVDADSIAQQVMDAKRSAPFFSRYLPSVPDNVTFDIGSADDADPSKVGSELNVASTAPVDATVALNDDKTQFVTTPAQTGTGVSVANAARELLDFMQSLGSKQPQNVELTVSDVQPSVTDDIASSAADTLNGLIANPVTIKGDGGDVATLGADAIDAGKTIQPDTTAALSDGQQRVGYVVFDASAIQSYYDNNIKTTFQPTEEDRDIIVNNDDEVLQTNSEGHPGVVVADGGDANVGTDAVQSIVDGTKEVTIDATVTPMKVNKTKRHVVVDLSDRLLYVYENDQVIKTLHVYVGRGIQADGSCSGSLCTPTGDFKIWWKLPEQRMVGSVTLPNGTKETWNAPGVRYINYFTKSGCAIHRSASSTPHTDADIATNTSLHSHGCVGIGWDVAEWFYGWCLYNETVHIQQ